MRRNATARRSTPTLERMTEIPVLALLIAVAAVPPAWVLCARVLVPAKVASTDCIVVSVLFAGGLVPFLIFLASGSPAAIWWLVGLMGVLPYLAALYLRKRARAPTGGALGFRAAAELSLLVMGIALTTGVAVWGGTHVS